MGVSSKKGTLLAAPAASRTPSKRGPPFDPSGINTFEALPPETPLLAAPAVSSGISGEGLLRDPSGGAGSARRPVAPLAASAVSGCPDGGTTCSSAESAAARLKGDPLAAAAVSGISSAALPWAFSDLAATPGPTNPSDAPPGVSFGVEGRGSRQALWKNLAKTLGDGSWAMKQLGE